MEILISLYVWNDSTLNVPSTIESFSQQKCNIIFKWAQTLNITRFLISIHATSVQIQCDQYNKVRRVNYFSCLKLLLCSPLQLVFYFYFSSPFA